MKSFIIASKDFRIRIKDRRGFMLMILMPLLLTFILGSALGGMMSNSVPFPQTNIGVVIPDQDALAQQLINDVLQSNSLKPYITIETIDSGSEKSLSKDSLKQEIRKGTIDAALIFPEGWSQKLNEDGTLKQLTVLTDPGKSLQSNIIKSIVQTYIDRVQTVAVSAQTVLSQPSATGQQNQNISALSQGLVASLQAEAQTEMKAVDEQSEGKEPLSGMQYYAAAMAAMFLLFNIMNGAKALINERDTQTLDRLLCTPASKLSILLGKFLGTLYFALAQFLIYLVCTEKFLKVSWGNNAGQTIAIGAAYAIAVSGLSMVLAAVLKTEKSADAVGGMGVQILALLGGSMIPISVFPDVMQKLAHFTPNTWALTSFLEIMGGTTWNSLFLPLGVLTLIGIASTMIGSWRLHAR